MRSDIQVPVYEEVGQNPHLRVLPSGARGPKNDYGFSPEKIHRISLIKTVTLNLIYVHDSLKESNRNFIQGKLKHERLYTQINKLSA